MYRIGSFVLAALVMGCAPPAPPPGQSLNLVYEKSRGVSVRERVSRVELGNADFCVVVSVNGKRVRNSIDATQEASSSMGRVLHIRTVEQSLEPSPQRLTLACKTVHASPVGSLLGSSASVEGDVEFSPVPHGTYMVNGVLDTPEQSVWIEDANTGEVVTKRVTSKKS
jgi:hypothetical protein